MSDDAIPTTALSVLVAVGPPHAAMPPAITSALEQLSGHGEGELVVVEDGSTPELRAELARFDGPVRVRHNPGAAFGREIALVAGAAIARGSLYLIAAPEVPLALDALDIVTRAFAADPGLEVVLGTDRLGNPVPALAVRASTVARLGGPAAFEIAAGRDTAHGLMPPRIADALADGTARGRDAVLATGPLERPIADWTGSGDARAALKLPAFVPEARAPVTRPGLNVIGMFEAACGIGDAGRRYVEAIEETSIEYSTFSFHHHIAPPYPFEPRGPRVLSHDVNLVALNADQLPVLALSAGLELWRERYTIGIWFWELEQLSEQQARGARLVNEIWVATQFLRDAFSAGTDREVRVVPLPVRRRDGEPTLDRTALGLPGAFTFLTMFDFGSLAARKNCLATVRAFTMAFSPGEGPVLVLKALNPDFDPAGRAALDAAIGGRRDIVVIGDYLADEVVAAIIGHADCFVSLHRAEGFGLSLADAMAWGRPVIATGYSGNLEFMTHENSYLVDFERVAVPAGLASVYPLGSSWAEPSVEHAAALMRAVVANPSESAARGRLGQRDIRRSNSLARASRVIAARIDELGRLRRTAPSSRAERRRPPRSAVGARGR